MSKLHELLAVEGDLAAVAKKVTDEAANTFSKKADHFFGQTRVVKYLSAEREGENAVDEKAIVTTVGSRLVHVRHKVVPFFDAVLCKEATNQTAVADLVVDGVTLATGVPATFLLGLETKLRDLRKVYEAIPTLQPGVKWSPDVDAGTGMYTAPPSVSFKTEKTVNFKILVEATKEHPAQVEKWNEDVPVARIETTPASSMLTPRDKSIMLGRLDTLLRAVKKARQRANSVEVVKMSVGDAIFDFLHADVVQQGES